MKRQKFSREHKLEAVKRVRERGVSSAQAAQDLGTGANVVSPWVREASGDIRKAFPGHGQLPSLGVITKTFALERVRSILAATGMARMRKRDLPAHVVVYHAMALALCMLSSYREVLRCLLEGLQWLIDPALRPMVAGTSAGFC